MQACLTTLRSGSLVNSKHRTQLSVPPMRIHEEGEGERERGREREEGEGGRERIDYEGQGAGT